MSLTQLAFAFNQTSKKHGIVNLLTGVLLFLSSSSSTPTLWWTAVQLIFCAGVLALNIDTFRAVYAVSTSRSASFQSGDRSAQVTYGHHNLFKDPACDCEGHEQYWEAQQQSASNNFALLFENDVIFIADKTTSLSQLVLGLKAMTRLDGKPVFSNEQFFKAKAGTVNSYGRFFVLWVNPIVAGIIQEQ